MKKFKEFLCFLIPFIVLSILSVIFFVLQYKSVDVIGSMSSDEYLKLMIKDPNFAVALVNSYVPPVIIGGVICAVYKAIALLKKINISRKTDYIILFVTGFIASVIYIIALTKRFDFTNNLVYAMQVSLVVAFIFWIIELVIGKINKER